MTGPETWPPTLLALRVLGRRSAAAREIRSLAREGVERRRLDRVLLEGLHLASEALAAPDRIHAAILSPRILRSPEGRTLAERLAAGPYQVDRASDELLGDLGDVGSHQGVLLLVQRPAPARFLDEPAPPGGLLLVACGVQDPGNLGALARVAEAAWCAGLLCAGNGADPFSPRSLRASAGSLLRLPVAEAREADGAARALRRSGWRLAGATPRGGTAYREASLEGPLALFVGGEGGGLPAEIESALDEKLGIPMRPPVESLNVATAAALVLFEAAARRGCA